MRTVLMSICVVCFTCMFGITSQATVYVDSTSLLIDQDSSVQAGEYAYYSLRLKSGTSLAVDMMVQGGLTNSLTVWLLDLPNFQKFRGDQEFSYFEGTSGHISSKARYRFTVPKPSVYYLIMDNRNAIFAPRSVHVTAYETIKGETEESRKIKDAFTKLYDGYLKGLFIFDDFDVHVTLCGTENAFSTPTIIMCRELADALSKKGVPGATVFVFLHEASHSLLNLWGFPLHDNEDVADELATFLLLFVDQEDLALQAADYWAQDVSEVEALRKLYIDDRHAISPQRARNIINWIGRKEDLQARWTRLLMPRLTDEVLRTMTKNTSDPTVASSADRELTSRGLGTQK